MQIYNNKKEDGIIIQIKKKNYTKGEKSKSITIYGENINIAFGRITDLYEKLSNNQEITIRHKK